MQMCMPSIQLATRASDQADGQCGVGHHSLPVAEGLGSCRQLSLQVNMLHPDTLKILWKGYVNQLALSLMELDGTNRATARDRVAQLSQEACALLLRFAAANAHGFKTLSASHLEEARSEPPAWSVDHAVESPAECQASEGAI